MKKRVVWFDVDDVLVDTAAVMERTMEKYTGIYVPRSTWKDLSCSRIYGLDPSCFDEMRRFWVEDRMIERAPLFDGAAQAINAVVDMGYEVSLITARGWHPRGEAVTREMAENAGMRISDVVLVKFDQPKVALMKNFDCEIAGYVDDSGHHVTDAVNEKMNAALIRRPWNAYLSVPNSLGCVSEFPAWLENSIGRSMKKTNFSMP